MVSRCGSIVIPDQSFNHIDFMYSDFTSNGKFDFSGAMKCIGKNDFLVPSNLDWIWKIASLHG